MGKLEVEPGFMKVNALAEGRRMIEAELQSGDDE
jgi:hypothetical protein